MEYRLANIYDPVPTPQGVTGGLVVKQNYKGAKVLAPNVYQILGIHTIITVEHQNTVRVNLKGAIPVPGATNQPCIANLDFKVGNNVRPYFNEIILQSPVHCTEMQQKDAVLKYTSPNNSWYQQINLVALCLDDPDFLSSEATHIHGIRQYLDANTTPLPSPVTRGLTLSKKELKWWNESLHTQICIPTFLSTTSDNSATFPGNVKITITIPNTHTKGARYIASDSCLPGEREVLFNAYSTFQVDSSAIEGNVTHFRLTWVPEAVKSIMPHHLDAKHEREEIIKIWKKIMDPESDTSDMGFVLRVAIVAVVALGCVLASKIK